MRYRSDIDGLRAIAVMAVVLFHADVQGFSGGYVGVDVFFVISGFLITTIIVREVHEGRFSFLRFYDRRARRLLPALTAMVLVSSVVGWLVLLPDEMVAYGQSVSAIAVFASNALFWLKSGYFAGPAHEVPLLHTWSLAVEEQFYLLWPILIACLYRLGLARFLKLALLIMVVLGLLASEWMIQRSATTAFYLSPFRAWELALGGFLATMRAPVVMSRRFAETSAWLGLGLIIWSVIAFDKSTPFPGVHALAPTLGTALVLYSGASTSTRVRSVLSTRILVGLGLISYSFYLWHWPLLVLPSLHLSRQLTGPETLAVIGLSLAAALVSWKLVEQPFRGKPAWGAGRSVAIAFGVSILTAAAGMLMVARNGEPHRLPAKAQALMTIAAQRNPLESNCRFRDGTLPGPGECLLGDERQPPTALLWGDSHAEHFGPAIDIAGQARGWGIHQFSMSACPPLLHATRVDRNGKALACDKFNQAVFEALLADKSIKAVILASRWSLYSETTRPRGEAGGRTYLVDSKSSELSIENSQRVLEQSLRSTVAALRGHGLEVILLGQVPESADSPSKCLARAIWHQRNGENCRIPSEKVARRLRFSSKLLGSMSGEKGVAIYLPAGELCGADHCAVMIGDEPLYRDRHHLSVSGSRQLGLGLADAVWPKIEPLDGAPVNEVAP